MRLRQLHRTGATLDCPFSDKQASWERVHFDSSNALLRRLRALSADFMASRSSVVSLLRFCCSRSIIASYDARNSRQNLFLFVSSTASRQSPAHFSTCHVFMMETPICSRLRSQRGDGINKSRKTSGPGVLISIQITRDKAKIEALARRELGSVLKDATGTCRFVYPPILLKIQDLRKYP